MGEQPPRASRTGDHPGDMEGGACGAAPVTVVAPSAPATDPAVPPPPLDFRALFESAPGLYLVLTPDFRIAAASDAYLQATMTTRAGVLGRAIFDVFPDNPDDPAATGVHNLNASLSRVVRDGVTDAMAVQKYDVRRPEGEGGGFEERYWSPANFPVAGADRAVAWIIHRVEDVTEFVRLKQQGLERDQLTAKLLTRGEQMEAEIFLRAQEIQECNRRLRETNEALEAEIAERHRVEGELREAHLRLQGSYQARGADLAEATANVLRLAAIVESSEDAIIGRTPEGVVTSWNAGAERLLGYQAEEALGRPSSGLLAGTAEGDEWRRLECARPGAPVPPFETTMRRKDGTPVSVSVSLSPIRDQEGRGIGSSVIVRDISGRVRLEEQLHQAQKMDAVGQLAGGVAHDFNNLLTVISGYSSLVISRLRPNDPTRELIEEIEKAADRAAQLTRQLLVFSRKEVVERRVLDLNAVILDTERMLGRMLGEDISLFTALDPALCRVRADPGQINQVILNLAVNARDAMPRGGKLTIETRNVLLDGTFPDAPADVTPGRYVLLAVSDTGCGMSQETQARIFEPFFTTKGTGKGTGLGLSTVYGIVIQSAGHVGVYSEQGRGTTFKVYLPPANDPAPGPPPAAAGGSLRGDETVLLVEDEDAVRGISRLTLRAHGYTVIEARNGVEAVRVGERHRGPIHLLLTDVVMPDMGGREVAERLTGLRPGIKVLFLSGYTDDAVVRHGILHAEVQFLQKPFTPIVLAAKVRDVLGRHES